MAWWAVAFTTLPVTSERDPDCAMALGELSTVPSAASTCPRAGHTACSTNRSPARSPGKIADGLQLTHQLRFRVTSCSWPWYFQTTPLARSAVAAKRACAEPPFCVTRPSTRRM